MCRSNDADVDLHGVRIADPLELAFLQHAQQFRLERGTHRRDLVEKQRPFVRLFEPPLPRGHRPGEGAPRMTEQLCFQQRLRDRAAVDRDEAVRTPRTPVMDRARRQLLAGSGFTGNQHRAGGGRDGLEQLREIAHGAAAADESVDAIALLQLRTQIRVLRAQAPLLEGGVQDVQQRVELERLGDEVRSALFDGVDGVLHRAEAGDDDGDDVGITRERGIEDGAAIEPRQPQVRNDDVEGEVGEPGDRVLAVGGLLDDEPVVGEPLRDGFPQCWLVVYQQQMFCVISHLVRRRYFDTPLRGGQCANPIAARRPLR